LRFAEAIFSDRFHSSPKPRLHGADGHAESPRQRGAALTSEIGKLKKEATILRQSSERFECDRSCGIVVEIGVTDGKTSARMTGDVDADEQTAIAAISELRRSSAISLETIGFMLGTGANQISRYLNRSASITLTNYLRIARSLGYRCRIVLERAEDNSEVSLSNLNMVSHKAHDLRASRERG
jgi:hypothetical protein